MSYEKFTIRIPKTAFKTLKEEAARLGISKAEFIRRWLEGSSFETAQKNERSAELEKETNEVPQYALLVETVLLLRAFTLQRDSQILRKIDTELDQLFGTKRRKIYES